MARADRYYRARGRARQPRRHLAGAGRHRVDAGAEPQHRGLDKLVRRAPLLGCVAAIAQRQGDAFGLLICQGERAHFTPAARGPRQLQRVLASSTAWSRRHAAERRGAARQPAFRARAQRGVRGQRLPGLAVAAVGSDDAPAQHASTTRRASSSRCMRCCDVRQVELRTRLSPVAAAGPVQHRVVLTAVAERAAAWRSLFTAFDRAGTGASRYVMASEPDANTELIVWDSPDAPPANWRAPHWWIAAPSTAAFPELARAPTLVINGITLKYIDSPRGRLWASDAWPARDADTARAVYDAWQLLAASPAPAYPTQSQTFGAARSALPAITDAKPATWLALALLALFALERILTHARRN
jgi:hypothetical protein